MLMPFLPRARDAAVVRVMFFPSPHAICLMSAMRVNMSLTDTMPMSPADLLPALFPIFFQILRVFLHISSYAHVLCDEIKAM